MEKKLLPELINDLEQAMLKFNYSNFSMKLYRKRWQMLLQFAEERGQSFYSEQLGIDFLEKKFHIFEKDFNDETLLSETQRRMIRIIAVIETFQKYNTVLYRRHKKILEEPYFSAISDQFKSYCIDKGYSKLTTGHYIRKSARFMNYLSSQNITNCKAINLSLIHTYIKTLTGYANETISGNVCSIRAFFRFLLEKKEIQTDFSKKIPLIRARKQNTIPSVWTADELKKLIAAIDRGSPKGKRDYAIILLACFLGMRCKDILSLTLDCFLWEEKKLVFTQSKTKNPLSLPLTQEVGWAVIDYLKYGRPKIDSPYLFVKHKAPFGPFATGAHLHNMIETYLKRAHLPMLKKKRGMHSLRHTMASTLLEKDTPLSTISNILGHINTNSTAIYLKVDMKKLKECALDFDEKNDHE